MQLAPPSPFVPTYRPPDRSTNLVMYPEHRETLRGIVQDALAGLEAVATTHDDAHDTLGRLTDGWVVNERYRGQLEAAGSIGVGEDLTSAVFASMQFRPRGSSDPVLGIERYGDVAIHWRPTTLERASISPWVSGSRGNVEMSWRGMQSGSMEDLADVSLDALADSWGMNSVFKEGGLYRFLSLPRADAVRGVTELLVQRQGGEAILRGVQPSAGSIEAISILTATPSPELDEIRAWAGREGIPVHDRAK